MGNKRLHDLSYVKEKRNKQTEHRGKKQAPETNIDADGQADPNWEKNKLQRKAQE